MARVLEDESPGEVAERARWLVQVRWGALAFAALGVGAQELLAAEPVATASGLLLLLAIAAAANAALHRRSKRGAVSRNDLFLSIALDVAVFTVALHLLGGVENPFQVYYVLPILLAGIALPRAQSYAIAGLASLLHTSMGVLEYAKVLPHHDVRGLPIWRSIEQQPLDQFEDARYVAGSSFVLLSTLLAATYLATTVAALLRRREREVRLGKERLDAIVRNLGEGVAYFDERGALALANPAFARILPAARDGMTIGACAPALATELEAATVSLRGGSSYRTFEASAGDRILACGLSAIPGGGGITLVVDDVTERRRAEARAQSERRLADLGVLAAGLAHEVLNPLASIASTAQLLDGANAERARAIGRHVDRITATVRGVTELARPAREPGAFAPIPLDELVADAIERAHEERPGAREVAVAVERPAPTVFGSDEPLRIALKNLVTNALDAAGAKGGVRLRVRAEKGDALVEVEDDGPGVDDPSSIFLPFFTTKTAGKGAGLGLSIAASIVRQHGGTIEVASEPGRGARFTVRLPREEVRR